MKNFSRLPKPMGGRSREMLDENGDVTCLRQPREKKNIAPPSANKRTVTSSLEDHIGATVPPRLYGLLDP
eukprot:679577-Lingulodinium_polyedra.AAC.1